MTSREMDEWKEDIHLFPLSLPVNTSSFLLLVSTVSCQSLTNTINRLRWKETQGHFSIFCIVYHIKSRFIKILGLSLKKNLFTANAERIQ